MGSGMSSAASRRWSTARRKKERELPSSQAESSRVLFLLYLIHRTWNVVVEHVDNKSGRWRGSRTVPSSTTAAGQRFDSVSLVDSDAGSTYSYCSCSYCRLRQCANDCVSELTLVEGMASCAGWSEEPVSKDKQRPPIYNPEDYATSLKKWGKKSVAGGLYAELEPPDAKARTLPIPGSKDYRNPCLEMGEEMSLRQFGSPSELLTKLRADLRLSFPSFVQEFACEPLDGVTLLLELLRNVQLSQSGDGAKGPLAVRRRPLLDELACLQCIWSCCSRYPESVRRLVTGSNGVYTLTVCIMSTVNKSRVLGLQLLTKSCYPPANGHSAVSEALSTLRLRYGEPVRFRFLVGMLQSTGGTGDLQSAGLSFINALLISAPTPQRKLYIQAELEQAGFDIVTLKKMVSKLPSANVQVTKEIENYEKQLIDIDTLSEKANEALKEKDDLRSKLELLEKRVKILQEEKGILLSLEKCLQEKCCELQEEVSSLRSEHGNSNRKKPFGGKKKNAARMNNRDESSPPEDEGISSSERSLSPEGDMQRESMVYEVFNVKNETYDLMRNKRNLQKKLETAKRNNEYKKSSDEEEETTIDDVIQELRNIVNDAETEQFAKERNAYNDDKSSRCNQTSEINVSVKAMECQKHKDQDKEDSITSTRHSIHITDSTEFLNEVRDEDIDETEIVPCKILPHPPRKSKSLIQLFPTVEQGLVYNKPPDIYDDNFYSSDEGSDSLLSSSRCRNQVSKKPSVSSFDFQECRALFNTLAEGNMDSDIRRSMTRSRDEFRRSSLKRSESFQTSEKGYRQREYIDSLFFNESSLIGSVKNHLQRSQSKSSRVDEIVSLIESKKLTKSLDRIDEGLNTMVDIVMMTEPKKTGWPYRQRSSSRSRSDTGKETPLIAVPQTNRNNYHQMRYDSRSSSNKEGSPGTKDSPQKFYLPHPKLSSGSFDNSSSYNNSSFIVKRVNTNAGFYSGNHIMRDAPASMTSLVINGTHSHADLKRNLSPVGSKHSFMGIPKVTDMPSGLY